MKSIMLWCALALGVSVFGCQSGSQSTADAPSADARAAQPESDLLPADATAVVLNVEGLSCPLCATNLEKELKTLPAAGEVSIDLETGRVTVPLKGGLTPTRSQLRRLVVNSGFSLRSIEVH